MVSAPDGSRATIDALQRSQLELFKRALSGYLQLGAGSSFEDFSSLNGKTYDFERFSWKIPGPARPHTLLTGVRLDALEQLMRRTIEEGVAGDYIEAGAHRGGAVIFMRAFLAVMRVPRRRVWVADSFEGIPKTRKPAGRKDIVDEWSDRWEVGLDVVRDNFMRYGLLDARVRFLKGFFIDTLPAAPIKRIAIMRLDSDSYESTMDALTHLYPKLSPGGYVIVDDHHLSGCVQAVLDYRKEKGITAPIRGVFRSAGHTAEEVFWQAETSRAGSKSARARKRKNVGA